MKIQEGYSGTIYVTPKIGEVVPHGLIVLKYKDATEDIRKINVWKENEKGMVNGIDLSNSKCGYNRNDISDDAYITFSSNDPDRYTYWIRINRPDLFNQLVEFCEKCGKKDVFTADIMWMDGDLIWDDLMSRKR